VAVGPGVTPVAVHVDRGPVAEPRGDLGEHLAVEATASAAIERRFKRRPK
jgi:hypothetical protein